MQVFGSAVDGSNDRVGVAYELSHALVPVILAMVAVVVFHRPAPVPAPDRRPPLRVVS